MSARYDSDVERIDAPSRAEAQADAIALGDLEPSVTPEQVAAYTAALNAHIEQMRKAS